MRTAIRVVLVAMGLMAAAVPAFSGAPWLQASAQPAELETKASHLFIYDATSKTPLFCQRCDEPMPPASMSKLMTIYVVMEKLKAGQIKPDTLLTVSENAWRNGAQSDGSHMFLELGSKVRVIDLIQGVIIVSANDACITLAEGLSGSEAAFVAEMNARARALGLTSARFQNVSGLPHPDHRISARDLALLADRIITEFPDTYKFYSSRTFTFNNHTQENRNPLLGAFPGADGVKTGHTDESGYGLIGSAVQNGQRRIVVFNGLPSKAARASEARQLMEAAFAQFKNYLLFSAGAKVAEAEVFMGAAGTVPLVAPKDISAVLHASARPTMKVRVVFDTPVAAPVAKGQAIGRLEISATGTDTRVFPLAAGEAVKRKGAFARALGALTGTP